MQSGARRSADYDFLARVMEKAHQSGFHPVRFSLHQLLESRAKRGGAKWVITIVKVVGCQTFFGHRPAANQALRLWTLPVTDGVKAGSWKMVVVWRRRQEIELPGVWCAEVPQNIAKDGEAAKAGQSASTVERTPRFSRPSGCNRPVSAARDAWPHNDQTRIQRAGSWSAR